MEVEIQNNPRGIRNTENLINSLCFNHNFINHTSLNKKFSQVHVIFKNLVNSACFAMKIVQN